MKKEDLVLTLTGVENPQHLTKREDLIIDKCLMLINSLEKQLYHTDFTPESALDAWDNIEVSPVHYTDLFVDGRQCVEVCEEHEVHFWSVYLHQVEGGVQCVADLPSKELAHSLAKLIHNASTSRQVKPY